jgi:hypothetical protein
MNVRLATLLTLSLTTTGFCAAVQTDPNRVDPNVEFKEGLGSREWRVLAHGPEGRLVPYINPGSIRPTYVAQFFLPRDRKIISSEAALFFLTKSPLAVHLSKAQQSFLAENFAIWVDLDNDEHPNHYAIWFYAVTEQDAKVMASAFLDFITNTAWQREVKSRDERDAAKQRLEQNQASLTKKQEQLESLSAQYAKIKGDNYPMLSDEEVGETTKEIVMQMDKETRIIEIDLAGVHGKLRVIEQYFSSVEATVPARRERLDAWKTEQMIELSGLEARKKAVEEIRAIPQKLCSLNRERTDLENTTSNLKMAIKDDTRTLSVVPAPDLYTWPVKIYGNVVLIYPIRPPTTSDSKSAP